MKSEKGVEEAPAAEAYSMKHLNPVFPLDESASEADLTRPHPCPLPDRKFDWIPDIQKQTCWEHTQLPPWAHNPQKVLSGWETWKKTTRNAGKKKKKKCWLLLMRRTSGETEAAGYYQKRKRKKSAHTVRRSCDSSCDQHWNIFKSSGQQL